MEEKVVVKKRTNKIQRRNDWLFIMSIVTWPIIVWLILYVGVHGNSFLMAFQDYDPQTMTFYFSGFHHLTDFVYNVFNDPELSVSMVNSMTIYFIDLLFRMPLSIIISFTIYKKIFLADFFKVMLLLPQMIASMIWVLIFQYLIEFGIPTLIGQPGMNSLITSPDTAFGTMLIYDIWHGLAGNLIIYTGTMSRVPVSLVEYGKLDGLKPLKELWYLTLPLIFPTITVFLVAGVVGVFTSSLAIYQFYGNSAPITTYTTGYYFFIKVFHAPSMAEYPYISAGGMVFSIIATPLTLFVKYLLEKFGPSVEY